jgi:hypothetical protein
VGEIQLTRSPDDRRRYELAGVGSLRFWGLFSRSADASAGAKQWRFERRGFWQRGVQAVDPTGARTGEFEPRTWRRGGKLSWAGHEFKLRPSSAWRERYALADGDLELAVVDGKSWGKTPVKVTLERPDAVDAGLLLFAAFVVRGLAEDTASAAGGAAATGGAVAGS